jgi:hypothetical protein
MFGKKKKKVEEKPVIEIEEPTEVIEAKEEGAEEKKEDSPFYSPEAFANDAVYKAEMLNQLIIISNLLAQQNELLREALKE